MTPTDWQALALRCQKPDYRTVGNWYARRIMRPLALRVTRVMIPTGLSAHAMTLLAWGTGLAATGALAWGTTGGWLMAAGLLQLSYLLDHVDGQLARYYRTTSLDGVQLDYQMHHTLNLLIPLAAGYGRFAIHEQRWYLAAGLAWGLGAWLLGSEHDVRCKALVSRLKRLEGELRVIGGGGGRPTPAAAWPRTPWRMGARLVRMLPQWHAVVNTLGACAIGAWLLDPADYLLDGYIVLLALAALPLGIWQLVRSTLTGAAEQEFSAWFRVHEHELLCEEQGCWSVVPFDAQATTATAPGVTRPLPANSVPDATLRPASSSRCGVR